MANKTILTPTIRDYEFNPTKTDIGIGDTIQDAAITAQELHSEVSRLVANGKPTEVAAQVAKRSIPVLTVINYRPTMFGKAMGHQVLQSFQDFYNKVTGSALQATSISYADLGAFLWLGKEYRAMIKDIDRALWIYNQTCLMNPVYGKKLIDSIYGNGVYGKLSAHADALNRMRNQLAKKINVQLPLLKGTRWTAIDDLCLDNIYADDPDAKTALIAFAREGYSVVFASLSGLVELDSFNFWRDFVNYDIDMFVERVMNQINILTGSVWFTDVRPYIENLQRKGGFHEDAGISESFMDKVANREFTPVYSTEVIDMIRNANIFRTKKYETPVFGTTISEDENGYLVDNIKGQPAFVDGSHHDIFATNYIKNFETYPATKQTVIKSLAFDFIPSKVSSTNDDVELLYASGSVITGITVHYAISGYSGVQYYAINITSNMGMLLCEESSLPAWYDRTSISLFTITPDEFRIIFGLNGMIRLNIALWNTYSLGLDLAAFYADVTDLAGKIKFRPYMHDIDNVVKLSTEFLTNYYTILAYEQVYDSEAISAVAGK